ncbi:MAG TPA: nuclear transport factor 2 family protein [bacterium]|nr:nuclear transport factor 2 family protein [bacterium]
MTVAGDDYAAILALYARVYAAADDGQPEAFGACYTAGGTLTIAGKVACRGRSAVIERNRTNVAARARTGVLRRHWCSQILLEGIADGSVRGRCYFQAYDITPGAPPVLTHVGRCDDVMAREDSEWRFASRSVSFDFALR